MRSACAGEASRHNCHVCGPEASPSAAVMVRRLCLCPSLLQTPRLGGSGKLSDLKGATGACSSTHALSYCLPCRKLSHAPYSNARYSDSAALLLHRAIAFHNKLCWCTNLACRVCVFRPQVAGWAGALASRRCAGGKRGVPRPVGTADGCCTLDEWGNWLSLAVVGDVTPLCAAGFRNGHRLMEVIYHWLPPPTCTPVQGCVPGAAARCGGGTPGSRYAHAPPAGLSWQADPAHRDWRGALPGHPVPPQLPGGSGAQGSGALTTCWAASFDWRRCRHS